MAYYGRGYVLEELGKWELAAEAYDNALAVIPDFAQALAGKSRVLAHQGHNVQSLSAMKSAANVDPAFGPASLRQAGWEAMERRDYAAVIRFYSEAGALGGPAANDHYMIGLAHQSSNRLNAALSAFSQAVRAAPEDPRFLLQRANLLRQLGDSEGAARDFDKLLTINPKDAEAAGRACEARVWSNRDLAGAMRLCDTAIAGDSSGGIPRSDLFLLRGIMLLRADQPKLAWSAFDEGARLAPYRRLLTFGRAIAAERSNDAAGAAKDFKTAGSDFYVGEIFKTLGVTTAHAPAMGQPLAAGLKALKAKRYDEARRVFEAAANPEKNDFPALSFGRAIAVLRTSGDSQAGWDAMGATLVEPAIPLLFARMGAIPSVD